MSYIVQIVKNVLANNMSSIKVSDVCSRTIGAYHVRCHGASASRKTVKLIKKTGREDDMTLRVIRLLL